MTMTRQYICCLVIFPRNRHTFLRAGRHRFYFPQSPMGTLVSPQRGEGADGCPRKSLAAVLLYRGEVRRWRTSVRYADHVTTVACRWLLCPFGHLGGLRRPPAGRFAKKPRNEAFCVLLFELFGGGNGVCKSYNFILRPQIACKSRVPNGQKYSRRRQNDTPYSPLPGRFGGGYTSSRI